MSKAHPNTFRESWKTIKKVQNNQKKHNHLVGHFDKQLVCIKNGFNENKPMNNLTCFKL